MGGRVGLVDLLELFEVSLTQPNPLWDYVAILIPFRIVDEIHATLRSSISRRNAAMEMRSVA